MRTLKTLGFAGALVAAAVVGGTLINVVAAGQRAGSGADPAALTDDTQPGAYCQTFLETFAAKLGVDESALLPAAKAAADAAIDKAVADGKLSKDAAEKLKARVANASGNMCGLLGARLRFPKATVMASIGSDMLSAAAKALGLSVADLKGAIAGGKSLKAIASDQKVDYATVKSAVHDAAKADLDKLVTAKTITADRETAILDKIDQALDNGRLANAGLEHPGLHRLLRPFAPRAPASIAPSASGTSS